MSADTFSATPWEVCAAIERDANQLDLASRQLSKAILDAAKVTYAYEDALTRAKISIVDEYTRRGDRVPGEDVRTAMCLRALRPGLYEEYLTKRAEVEALRAWARGVEHALSGRQSLLAILKSEVSAR